MIPFPKRLDRYLKVVSVAEMSGGGVGGCTVVLVDGPSALDSVPPPAGTVYRTSRGETWTVTSVLRRPIGASPSMALALSSQSGNGALNLGDILERLTPGDPEPSDGMVPS